MTEPSVAAVDRLRKITSRMVPAAVLLLGLAVAGCDSGKKTASGPATTTRPPTTTVVEEGFPDEGITETTKPEVRELRVGEASTLAETDTGREVARVLVSKVEAIRGEEYNEPERGWFLGVHVKVKALADDQTSLWGDFYVTMRGHHYDPDAYAERWKPNLGLCGPQPGGDRRGVAGVRHPRPPRPGRPRPVLWGREDRHLELLMPQVQELTGAWGTLRVETEVIEVPPSITPEPDERWSFTDRQGHRHAYAAEGAFRYPTLRWVVDETCWCEDCQDEHQEGHWECEVCGERITPGTRGPDLFKRFLAGRTAFFLDGEPIREADARRIVSEAGNAQMLPPFEAGDDG